MLRDSKAALPVSMHRTTHSNLYENELIGTSWLLSMTFEAACLNLIANKQGIRAMSWQLILVSYRRLFFRIFIWAAAEVLLGYLGVDEIADYSEFLTERPIYVFAQRSVLQ